MTATRIAYFVTPHGFGHAARAAAVMGAVAQINPEVQFEIFTSVPAWFFQDSLAAGFACHFLNTDVGLVQASAFKIDFEQSLQALGGFYPLAPSLIARLAETVRALNCALILCDIAPLGLFIAQQAGIPSVLVENFTWDWIYQQYAVADKCFTRHIDYLGPIFKSADYHIQTEPVCCHTSADLSAAPVSRKPKTAGTTIRKRLGLTRRDKLVLITTGGIPGTYGFLDRLAARRGVTFLLPGTSSAMKIIDNLILLPHRSEFYHPDLVDAANAVIGKVGYSTVAEVYQSGTPFGYVARSNFRESESMVEFIQKRIPAVAVDESEFADGNWISKLGDLLDLTPLRRDRVNGADQIARFIKELLS